MTKLQAQLDQLAAELAPALARDLGQRKPRRSRARQHWVTYIARGDKVRHGGCYSTEGEAKEALEGMFLLHGCRKAQHLDGQSWVVGSGHVVGATRKTGRTCPVCNKRKDG